MTAEKEKIRFIAAARFIGILLVVFGHSFPFGVYVPPILWKLQAFLYTFHMPLFLFLSGYLLAYNTRPAGVYIRRRASRLLVPYFVLSVLAFVPKMLVQSLLNDAVEFSLWHLVKTELIPRANVWGHFWYLPVVFTLCGFGVLVQKSVKQYRGAGWALLAVSFLLLFLPQATDWFALEDLRKTAFYFVLGMVTAQRDPRGRVISGRYWLLALPAAVALFAALRTTLTDSVIACLMIGFVLHCGTRLSPVPKGFFAAVEKNSYSIFLLSWPAQAVAEVVCNKLLHFPALLTMGIMFLAGIAVPLVCVKIVSLTDKRYSMKWVKAAIGM